MALEGAHVLVCKQMPFQGATFNECHRAVVALEGAFTCVTTHMPREGGTASECLWAEVALEGALACVCVDVFVNLELFLHLVSTPLAGIELA